MKCEQINYEQKKITRALRAIGLALNASNGLLVTDKPDAQPDDEFWNLDHSSELKELDYIKSLFNSTDICPLCESHNNDL